MKAELGLGADGACSAGDVSLANSKDYDADDDSEASSEFGACLDDSKTREFVGGPMENEQVEGNVTTNGKDLTRCSLVWKRNASRERACSRHVAVG